MTRALATSGVARPQASLDVLRCMPSILRGEDRPAQPDSPETSVWDEGPLPWEVTAVVALDSWDRPEGPPQLLALLPGDQADRNFGAAVGHRHHHRLRLAGGPGDRRGGGPGCRLQRPDRPRRGRDLPYHLRQHGTAAWPRCRRMVVGTINLAAGGRVQTGRRQHRLEIFKLAVAGNTTMMHLLLAIPPDSIRLAPYIPVVNHVPTLTAGELGLAAHPQAHGGLPAGRGELCRRATSARACSPPRWMRPAS